MAGVMLTSVTLLLGLRSFAGARQPSTLQRDVLRGVADLDGSEFSRNVSSCPGMCQVSSYHICGCCVWDVGWFGMTDVH